MNQQETYKILNQGKEVSIDNITEEHWKEFDKDYFLRIVFQSDNPYLNQNCKKNIFVNAFYYQIIYGKDYLKKLLEIAKKKAPFETINKIQEVSDILSSYSIKDSEDLKAE